MPEDNDRSEYIAGLRALADALESNLDLVLPFEGGPNSDLCVFTTTKEEVQDWARVMPGRKDKNVDDNDTYYGFQLTGMIRGLHLRIYANRNEVCTARVVGTKTVERRVPTAPVEYKTVIEEVDEVVWDCSPLLSEATA